MIEDDPKCEVELRNKAREQAMVSLDAMGCAQCTELGCNLTVLVEIVGQAFRVLTDGKCVREEKTT